MTRNEFERKYLNKMVEVVLYDKYSVSNFSSVIVPLINLFTLLYVLFSKSQ